MKLNYVIGNFFFYGEFEVHYIWYQRQSYNTGPQQGHINYLEYIPIYKKKKKILINLVVTNRKPLCFVLIMAAQEGAEIRMEGNL
jgi:hypothetical protein